MSYGIREPVPEGGIIIPRHGPVSYRELVESLPHGSGIDSDWVVEVGRDRVTFYNSYHGMDSNGYYDGWLDFRVCLSKVKADERNPLKGPLQGKVQVCWRKGDWRMDIKGAFSSVSRKDWGYDLRSYLYDTISDSLSKYKLHIRTETEDA